MTKRPRLKGPRGITIQGPEVVREGESDELCWVYGADDYGSPTMFIRFLKDEWGVKKEEDSLSLFIALTFRDGSLWIHPNRPVGCKNRGFFNPYRNAVQMQVRAPSLCIQHDSLRDKTAYRVHVKTNAWGDFLCLEALPHRSEKRDGPRDQLMVNLWAVFSFSGLYEVRSDGSLFFDDQEPIGAVNNQDGWVLPFFRVVKTNPIELRATTPELIEFERRSATRAFELVRSKNAGVDSPIDIFGFLNWLVYQDRATTKVAEGRELAKGAFADLFSPKSSRRRTSASR